MEKPLLLDYQNSFYISESDSQASGKYVRIRRKQGQTGLTTTNIDWIEIQPESGVIDSGDSIKIQIQFNSETLEWGTSHNASLLITSNDTSVTAQSIPISLEIADITTNYGLYQETDAISCEPKIWEPGHAVDGDTTTDNRFWRVRFYPFTSLPGDWWQVKMAETYWINNVIIFQGIGADFFNQFHVESSTSGEFNGEETTLFSESNWISGNNMSKTYSFQDTRTKFVRLVNDEQKDWAGLQEFQIYYTNITDIKDVENTTIPRSYKLSQNYPNPFNSRTIIRFQLPVKGFCSLNIYNIIGQKVKTLIEEDRSAGYHTIFWDGTNDYNEKISSGIYIYRLEAGDTFRAIRKVVFIN
jgi:hypothetical protein